MGDVMKKIGPSIGRTPPGVSKYPFKERLITKIN